ncbi:MAG TPA: polysaccharide biosynthesis tyrosine autokinase [Puia sp.]|nr:polysaccharide biosynthesis tyrosine autokinase [Puia sp.]
MQVTHKNGIEEEKENMFGLLLNKYMPFWPLFLSLVLAFGVLAWLYIHFLAVPVYEISASILVKDEKKGLNDATPMNQLDMFDSKKLVENEIEVIQAKMLMRQVVKKLLLYAPVTYDGGLRKLPAYVYSPVVIQAENPDSLIVLEKSEKVYFTYDSATRQVVLRDKHYPLNQWIKDTVGVIRFLANPNYSAPEEVRPLYFSLVNVKQVTENIFVDLKVTQASKLSSVIDLVIKDPIPKRGEDILNSLINVYNRASVNDKNALASNTLRFINERLALISTELDSVELGVQKYKTSEGITDISSEGQLYLANVGENDKKISEINVQLAVMEQVEKYLRSKNNQPGIVPATFGINDPVLAELLDKLSNLEIKYDGLRKTTAENNPLVISLRNQIEALKPNILENVRNQRANLEAGKQNLVSTSNQYASALKGLPLKERKLISISRQQTVKNGIYSFLLQKKEETALSYNSAIADTRLVDDADSSVKPVKPKHILVYLGAVVAAISIGAGFVEMRQAFNKNIISRKEIEQYTTVPVIGEISSDLSGRPIVIGDGGQSFIAEQFRQLRTTLAYIGINNQKKKILVTSSVSGEGKTFVASNLALTLALTNKKVVLIELDLRKPKLAKLFNVSQEIGITDYFAGNKDADHIIKRTEANKNLFFIPSGHISPNPSELILNGRLPELLEYLDGIFDYIVIDSAPVSPVTDSYIVSTFCDATLYIIRQGVTPKIYVRTLDENREMRTLKNIAIVFNGVKGGGLGQLDYQNYAQDESKKKKRRKDKV